MPSRWLVAYDFSSSADAALQLALEELEPWGGEVLLFHAYVVPDVPYAAPWPETETGFRSASELERSLGFEVAKSLEKVADEARKRAPKVTVEVLVHRGAPAEAIVSAAREHEVARVVMGTHGRRGFAHLLLGSVAERVLREVEAPVLVVKAPPEEVQEATVR